VVLDSIANKKYAYILKMYVKEEILPFTPKINIFVNLTTIRQKPRFI
jgi:hypothetical protein